jgi:eukaryotic-like serine/threonine-protein kinase
MHPGDSHESRFPHRAAGVALCVLLAVLFWAGADRLVGIERGYFDLFQRLAAGPTQAPVLILDTGPAADNPWLTPRFDELLLRTRAAGARLVLPASPPPATIAEQDIARLQALIALEKRSTALKSPTQPGLLARQLQEALQRLGQQQRNTAAVAASANLVLGLGTADLVPGREQVESSCDKRIAGASAAQDETTAGERLQVIAAVSPALCEAAVALGHLQISIDRDNVLRRLAPGVPTPAGMLPSAAMATARAAGLAAGDAPATGERWLRFHAGQQSAGFRSIPAAQVLAGSELAALKDQIVVIGSAGGSLKAAIGSQLAPAALLATEIANLADKEYISRPAWAAWAELLIALLLGMGAGLAGRLPLSRAAALGVAGAAVLLAAEYTLLLAGTWLHLSGLALFCLTGMAILQGLAHLPGRPLGIAGASPDDTPASDQGPGEELDLAFSVLRQQPTTDRTKEKLYDLAMEHGRKRDYARAERVFRHLAARDPGYRDVANKLEKLSGARGGPAKKAPSPAPAAANGAASAVPESTPGSGSTGIRTLGRYELERVIGRGAMATVYLGRDPTINRRVAIKTLPLAEEFEESDLAAARANFKREAESAGRLSHPHIISIYDAGEDSQVAYLAMEYIEGRSLSHYAQVGRLLAPRVVFELMARAAEALHYAHTQNVVHRDVKPANILYNPATDTMKITDFGIARLTDSSRTRTGIILGTPSYMSPEQLSASQVTGQSDLYSLGVTMYHLLTGAPPFQADSIPRLMDKIVNQRHRPVADIRDDVPPCADRILDQVLAKDPADRFPSGRALAHALRECASRLAADHI